MAMGEQPEQMGSSQGQLARTLDESRRSCTGRNVVCKVAHLTATGVQHREILGSARRVLDVASHS